LKIRGKLRHFRLNLAAGAASRWPPRLLSVELRGL